MQRATSCANCAQAHAFVALRNDGVLLHSLAQGVNIRSTPMRIPAKALPCLLSCLACITIAPCSATEAVAPSSLRSQSTPMTAAYAAASDEAPLVAGLHVGKGTAVATRKHAKAHRAAPKLVQSTPHDTSNRFLMTQNGKQMTADDFEAWMKARGIRVAKGTPEAAKGAD